VSIPFPFLLDNKEDFSTYQSTQKFFLMAALPSPKKALKSRKPFCDFLLDAPL